MGLVPGTAAAPALHNPTTTAETWRFAGRGLTCGWLIDKRWLHCEGGMSSASE